MLPRWQELVLPAPASAGSASLWQLPTPGTIGLGTERYLGGLLHLQLRALGQGKLPLALGQMQDRGPHSSHQYVPRATCLPAPSLLLGVTLSVCLCGSEAQGWSDSPHPTPSLIQLFGPMFTA